MNTLDLARLANLPYKVYGSHREYADELVEAFTELAHGVSVYVEERDAHRLRLLDESRRIIAKHRRMVDMSPGVGRGTQLYALQLLDEIDAELVEAKKAIPS